MRNTRYWMGQKDWFIDDAGSREATGADAGHPIPTIERQFRMGQNPRWNGEYHIRYLADSEGDVFAGEVGDNTAIFCHGSSTNGQGQSTLYVGTIDALTVQHTNPNDPWVITSNGLPTSWNALGLIGPFLGCRLRMTSGPTGAKIWGMKETNAKVARCSDSLQVTTFSLTSYGNPDVFTYPAVALGNTFVVEKLTQVRSLLVDLRPIGLVGPFGDNSPIICFESLKVGKRDVNNGRVKLIGRGTVIFDGCEVWNISNTGMGRVYMLGSQHGSSSAGGIIALKNSIYHGGFNFGTLTHNVISAGGPSLGIDNWIVQGGSLVTQQVVQVNQLGIFDATSAAVQILTPNQPLQFFQANGTAPKLWGSGNASFALWLTSGGLATYPTTQGSGFTIANGGPTDMSFPGSASGSVSPKTAARAFDDASGLYTAPRNLTFSNLLLSVAGGGFGGRIVDPQNGTMFAESGAPNTFG